MTLISDEHTITVTNASEIQKLAVSITGDSAGYPIFLLHGTPGSRNGPKPRPIVLFRQGVKLICYDRPGYGGSTRVEGRTVAAAADDVTAIADALEIDEFAVVGRSGGGPHALAVAAGCGTAVVSSIATLVSLAPYDGPGLDWFSGMSPYNRREYTAVDMETQALLDRFTEFATDAKADGQKLLDMLASDLSEYDAPVVGDVALRQLLLKTYQEGFQKGAEGWIDDVLAFRSPWKFQLSSVTCPALIWHGEDDQFSPVGHSEVIYREIGTPVKDKVLRIKRGTGHFGAVEALPAILSWIIDGVHAKQLATR